jgi:hypothetical protein
MFLIDYVLLGLFLSQFKVLGRCVFVVVVVVYLNERACRSGSCISGFVLQLKGSVCCDMFSADLVVVVLFCSSRVVPL